MLPLKLSLPRILLPNKQPFSAKGYKDKTVSNIAVLERQKTDLLVEMEPDLSYIEIPLFDPPVIYPNPAKEMLHAVLPKGLAGYINVKITGISGNLLMDFYLHNQEGDPLTIETDNLPSGAYILIFTNNASGARSKGRFIIVK